MGDEVDFETLVTIQNDVVLGIDPHDSMLAYTPAMLRERKMLEAEVAQMRKENPKVAIWPPAELPRADIPAPAAPKARAPKGKAAKAGAPKGKEER